MMRFLFIITTCVVVGVWTHPQCLDFLPPFANKDLDFCKEYAEYGCCTVGADSEIRRKHRDVITELEKNQGIRGCSEKVRQVLCLECHPFADHIYEAELTRVRRPFPGFCQPFCEDFYDSCQEAIPLITEDEDTRISAQSKTLFCEHVDADDPKYCYPDLDHDEELLYNISREGTTVAGCICLEEIASGLKNPLQLQESPDGTRRLFIAEQKGTVYIVNPNKTREQEPSMNITILLHLSSLAADAKGLLAFAFHPEYAKNRRLYAYYFIHHEGKDKTRLSEFVADANDQVDNDSERVLMDILQPYQNHNGGSIVFDPEGYLYLTLGDGGQQGDPHNYAQNLSSFHGKVLRLDIDSNRADGELYTIPEDNPFQDIPGARPEIYAYGMRNIWRCDVDEGDAKTGEGRGRIICGDGGQSTYEEINLIKSGGNYGWNTREGFDCYDGHEDCGKLEDEELPIYAYGPDKGRSIAPGHVYRGCLNPNLYGKYIYGDFVTGRMWTLKENSNTKKWESANLKTCGPDVCYNGLTGTYPKNILSFGEDLDGEVYMLTTLYASSDADVGKVFKIVDPRRRGNPTTCRSYHSLGDEGEESEESGEKDGATEAVSINKLGMAACIALVITII